MLKECIGYKLPESAHPHGIVSTRSKNLSQFWTTSNTIIPPVSLMFKMTRLAMPTSECVRYIGQTLAVVIDRPMGSKHPEHGYVYPINYGYIPHTKAGDGEEQDAYVLGVFKPIERIEAVCIAVIHRADDVEDKLVVTPEGKQYTDDQIVALTEFQEQVFDSTVIRISRRHEHP